jgi:hypothetical protein
VPAQGIGPTVVLDTFAKHIGLPKGLKAIFGDAHQQILVASYCLCVTGGALRHCEAWARSHEPGIASPLSSQRISKLLGALDTDKKQSLQKHRLRDYRETEAHPLKHVKFPLPVPSRACIVWIVFINMCPKIYNICPNTLSKGQAQGMGNEKKERHQFDQILYGTERRRIPG